LSVIQLAQPPLQPELLRLQQPPEVGPHQHHPS
jgi:hypothetical protein